MNQSTGGAPVTAERALEIAKEIIAIPSFKGEESALADWTADFLEGLGFEVTQQEVTPGQRQTIASLPHRDGLPSFMMNGHLDIDPLRSNWSRDPFQAVLEGNTLIGAGARNMQGGLVSILLAAQDLASSQNERANIVVALVAGELQGGIGTTHALQQGLHADLAVVPEPFGSDNLVTETWGVIEFAVTVTGASEHISKLNLARDPVPTALRLRERLTSTLHTEYNSQFDEAQFLINVGGILAGRGDNFSLNAANYSPDKVALLVDIRHSSLVDAKEVHHSINDLVHHANTDCADSGITVSLRQGSTDHYKLNEIDFPPHKESLSAATEAFLHNARLATTGAPFKESGRVFPHSYCGADTSHMGASGIPSVLVGPTGPLAQPGLGDDGVYMDEILETALFLEYVGEHLRGSNLG